MSKVKPLSELNRLELVNRLQHIEETKANFEKQLKAINSYYFQSGTISFTTMTTDYNHKGVEDEIAFDKDIMKEYIKMEIGNLTDQSKQILSLLAK